jgi:hypothetical protein
MRYLNLSNWFYFDDFPTRYCRFPFVCIHPVVFILYKDSII